MLFYGGRPAFTLLPTPIPKELRSNVHRVLAENIACGLDPDKVALYCQSHVPETAELYSTWACLPQRRVGKTTTFKDKVRQTPRTSMQVCSHIPGIDGGRHSPCTGPSTCLWGKTRSNTGDGLDLREPVQSPVRRGVSEPQAFNFNQQLVKVPSLDGTGKMSKSETRWLPCTWRMMMK